MSNRLTTLCRPIQMAPTAKAVLMSLADYADDDGVCWPSIAGLCEWTCYSERAVRNAIRDLEQAGYITTQASAGRTTNRYVVTANPAPRAPLKDLEPAFNPAADAPFNPASDDNPASGAGMPTRHLTHPTRHLTTPTRHLTTSTRQQVPPNHQEPPRTTREATTKKGRSSKWVDPVPMPEGVDPQTWTDWLSLRKAKDAPVTVTVLREATREAGKAGLTLTRFLEIWCARGSQGLQADWLKPNERGPPSNGAKPSAAADFRGKTYDATPDDQLPIGLR